MKTIIIKLYIVLCCNYNTNTSNQYEVRSIIDSNVTYTVYSNTKYNVGDTIPCKQYITFK